jgi:hypothetical protein
MGLRVAYDMLLRVLAVTKFVGTARGWKHTFLIETIRSSCDSPTTMWCGDACKCDLLKAEQLVMRWRPKCFVCSTRSLDERFVCSTKSVEVLDYACRCDLLNAEQLMMTMVTKGLTPSTAAMDIFAEAYRRQGNAASAFSMLQVMGLFLLPAGSYRNDPLYPSHNLQPEDPDVLVCLSRGDAWSAWAGVLHPVRLPS